MPDQAAFSEGFPQEPLTGTEIGFAKSSASEYGQREQAHILSPGGSTRCEPSISKYQQIRTTAFGRLALRPLGELKYLISRRELLMCSK